AFGSLELGRLIAAAQRNNTDLRAAALRVAQAAALTRAAGASLYPAVDASALSARSGVFEGRQGDRSSWEAALNASYEVDFWGRNRAGLVAARAQEAAVAFDLETVALTLTADVATTYFQYLALGERLATARANLANARRILE